MLNHIILQGRFVADADLRHTQSGRACARYRIAVERNYKDASGERGTDFINCLSWGNQAEMIARYFHRGDMIIVSGELQIRPYTDQAGQSRTAAEVNVREVNFAGAKKVEAPQPAQQQEPAPPTPPVFTDVTADIDDGELPF